MQWRWLIVATLVWAPVILHSEELGAGNLLVASVKSHDQDLARTVILLIHYDQQGAIGLIVNRRSNVPLSEVFPEMKAGSITVYAGGPVTIGIRALLRSRSKPEQAVHVFADVSVISNKPLLEKLVAAGTPSSSFRVYAGYTGWSAEQLKSEIALGLWHVLPGDAGAVFDPNPEMVWPRLIGRLRHVQRHDGALVQRMLVIADDEHARPSPVPYYQSHMRGIHRDVEHAHRME